jgi:hypothetical protein
MTKYQITKKAGVAFLTLLILLALVIVSCADKSSDISESNNGSSPAPPKWNPGHYIFLTSSGMVTEEFINTSGFRGVQVRYFWKDLEPEKDQYDFTLIRNDLKLVAENGKQLFIQLQWKCFSTGETYAPKYIVNNPDHIYYSNQHDTINPPVNPRIWDTYVLERFNKLIEEIGKSFDQYPNLEGINLPESAPSASVTELARTGYYPLDANGNPVLDLTMAMSYIKSNMLAMKKAFPLSLNVQYMNGPPKLFTENRFHEVFLAEGIGMGGPDVSFRANLLNNVYKFYPPLSGFVPLCSAVQSPDYDFDGIIQEVRDLYELGRDTLKLNHIFWSPKEPWWSDVKELVVELTEEYGPAGGLDSIPPLSIKDKYPDPQ